MSWIKTDWDFGCPMVRLQIGLRWLAVNKNRGDGLCHSLVQAMAAESPDLIERITTDLILRHRPELKGCCIIGIDGSKSGMWLTVFVVHPLLPRKANGEMPDEISLIPEQCESVTLDAVGNQIRCSKRKGHAKNHIWANGRDTAISWNQKDSLPEGRDVTTVQWEVKGGMDHRTPPSDDLTKPKDELLGVAAGKRVKEVVEKMTIGVETDIKFQGDNQQMSHEDFGKLMANARAAFTAAVTGKQVEAKQNEIPDNRLDEPAIVESCDVASRGIRCYLRKGHEGPHVYGI